MRAQLIVTGLLVSAVAALAQEPPLDTEVLRCTTVPESRARLDCYDSLARAIVSPESQPRRPDEWTVESGTDPLDDTTRVLLGLAGTKREGDNDEAVVSVARRNLQHDPRVTFVVSDGAAFVGSLASEGKTFDLVFADTRPGKYTHLQEALRLVKVGGLYVVDDMLPQPNWPNDHPPKVAAAVATRESTTELKVTMLTWSTGVAVAARLRPAEETRA